MLAHALQSQVVNCVLKFHSAGRSLVVRRYVAGLKRACTHVYASAAATEVAVVRTLVIIHTRAS